MELKKKNIAVILGGRSPEHEVSVITGVQVLNKIDKSKYNTYPIYISKDGRWFYSDSFNNIENLKNPVSIPYISREVYLSTDPNEKAIIGVGRSLFGKQFKAPVDVFFPCMHGGTGENGALQGLFEVAEIPYVGSEVLGSALGMDKVVCKDIFSANHIPTAPYTFYYREKINNDMQSVVKELEEKFQYPMFVKPAVGGSSVGVTKAKDQNSLKNGLELAAIFDSKVIVEQGIENAKEVNISVMGNTGGELKVSACEEVFHKGEFLTYDDKYKGGDGKSQGMASTKRKIPAELRSESLELVTKTAKKAFEALNCMGLVRIDFLVKEETQEVFIIEVNTIPGSMAFYLWDAAGLPFSEMITQLIELAGKRAEEKAQNTTTFSTNILQDFRPGLKNPKLG